MKFVYVLEQGASSEGGWVVGLYNNEDSALWDLAIAFNERYDRFKDWRVGTTDNEDMMPRWYGGYAERGATEFESGCDYWVVSMHEIHD